MFAEHMKERERRKRAEEKAARKRKLQEFRELLERTSDIKVQNCRTLRLVNHICFSTKGQENPKRLCMHAAEVVHSPSRLL